MIYNRLINIGVNLSVVIKKDLNFIQLFKSKFLFINNFKGFINSLTSKRVLLNNKYLYLKKTFS